ncbi:glutathione S-transferase N-terminal domain-containing protein [Novosphingobium pokkalii]|uniref:glutathione S-transferase N-terminal domain-containing protein n=1 Tax=Novosphingobium pokkalii TaxID=1770194 RepID=UPI0036410CCE
MIWLLEELGATYEIRPVSIFRPMTGEGQGDPANPHPDKRVPALVHDGRLLAESVAIVLYLLDAFPQAGLAPAPADRRRGIISPGSRGMSPNWSQSCLPAWLANWRDRRRSSATMTR